MPHHEKGLRIAAVFRGVLMRPANRPGHIDQDVLHLHLGNQPVVDRDENIAAIDEGLRLHVHLGLAAALPAAAVNPDYDGMIRARARCVDIEGLPLSLGLDISEVANHPAFGSQERGSDEKQGGREQEFHGETY